MYKENISDPENTLPTTHTPTETLQDLLALCAIGGNILIPRPSFTAAYTRIPLKPILPAAHHPDPGKSNDEPIPSEDFRFFKAGDIWVVHFGPNPAFYLKDSMGCKYIDWLLHHPNEVITCLQLEAEIQPERRLIRSGNSIQHTIDSKAKQQTAKVLGDMIAMRDKLESSGRMVEAGEYEEQIQILCNRLESKGIDHDHGEKARNNVRKAIGNVIKKLRKGTPREREFGVFLDLHIRKGYEIMYSEPRGDIWR